MVCSIGSGKMTALAGLRDAGSVSQTVTGEAGHMKSAAQYLRRKLCEADEENLLDEEEQFNIDETALRAAVSAASDMHIFGLRPMTDPLDLVCCNACKKPIKASQYAAHAELCKSLSSILDSQPERNGLTVNRKPPRKERKKLPVAQTKKVTSLKHPKNLKAVDSEDIDASESRGDETIQITKVAEMKRNIFKPNHKTNGSRVCQYSEDCSEHVRKSSSKPLKRGITERVSSPGTKNLGETIVEVQPHKFPPSGKTFSDAPAPIATKIYYSQRNYHLRRAIHHMFCDESSKESSSEVSCLDVLQANAAPRPMSNRTNFCQEQSENQQRGDYFLQGTRTSTKVHAVSSDYIVSKSGGYVPSLNIASQLPMNDTLEPYYLSNSHSFSGRTRKPSRCCSAGQWKCSGCIGTPEGEFFAR